MERAPAQQCTVASCAAQAQCRHRVRWPTHRSTTILLSRPRSPDAVPASTTPSTGTRSPGSTRTTSPSRTVAVGTSISSSAGTAAAAAEGEPRVGGRSAREALRARQRERPPLRAVPPCPCCTGTQPSPLPLLAGAALGRGAAPGSSTRRVVSGMRRARAVRSAEAVARARASRLRPRSTKAWGGVGWGRVGGWG